MSLVVNGNFRASYRESILTALFVCTCSALVAASGVLVTAGGNDQRDYHWVTIQQMRENLPHVDVVNVQTATAPLYHLIVTFISGPLHLTQSQTQFVGSLFAAALAAVTVWFVAPVNDASLRALAVAPLLLSPYFWQSALWMLNDDAALLFGLAALALILRHPGSGRSQICSGLLIAAAIATRQSYVWLLVPAVVTTLFATRGYPRSARSAAAVRIALPGLMVVAFLASVWHGFAPPVFQEMNAAIWSWVSLSYCFAVAAVFFLPILVSIGIRRLDRPLIPIGLGMAAAIPASIFESSATKPPDSSRRGSLIWTLVAHTPTIAGRSILLASLAFAGAWAVYLVLANLDRKTALLVGSGLVALSVAMVAGGRLYQKYFELPIAALALITIAALASSGAIKRRWPLLALAGLQAVLLAGIVVKPIVSAI